MENSIFFAYLAIAIIASFVMFIVLKRILATRARKIQSKKGLERFLTKLSESYLKALYMEDTTYPFWSKSHKMRQSIQKELGLEFNHLFCILTHFPSSLQKDYIHEDSAILVDKMIPILQNLQYKMLEDKYSRPDISTLQKIFFDRMEVEMIHHLSTQDKDE